MNVARRVRSFGRRWKREKLNPIERPAQTRRNEGGGKQGTVAESKDCGPEKSRASSATTQMSRAAQTSQAATHEARGSKPRKNNTSHETTHACQSGYTTATATIKNTQENRRLLPQKWTTNVREKDRTQGNPRAVCRRGPPRNESLEDR